MPTVFFLSECCLLDPRSGAAHSARAMLRALAQAGFDCHALTLNLCDGEEECPLQDVDPSLDPAHSAGRWVVVEADGLRHRIHVSHSTRHRSARPWSLRTFYEGAADELARHAPDLLLTYGSEQLRPLWAQAKRQGAVTVFYLANPGYARQPGWGLPGIDKVVVPSRALAEFYGERLPAPPLVLGDLVDAPIDGRLNLETARIGARRNRFVTIVNPDPLKGGLFFLNLAARAVQAAPGLRFRAVESRWGRVQWERKGADVSALSNLDWLPNTRDMARVYDEAALLLVPSLWFEASARVVAEALLAGVPVLAMRTGGIPEQLGGGGFMFDLPEALRQNPLAMPSDNDLQPWLHFIQVLMRDDAIYSRAVRLSLQASKRHDRAAREAYWVQSVRDWLARPPAGADADPRVQRVLIERREAYRVRLGDASKLQPEAGEAVCRALLAQTAREPAWREARAAFDRGALEQARDNLEHLLHVLPQDIAALALLADVAEAQGQMFEARGLLERVVTLAPNFVLARQQLAQLFARMGEIDKALVHGVTLMERVPQQPLALALQAGLLAQAGRFNEAATVYEACFRQDAGQPQDWVRYGQALLALDRREEAIEAFSMATSLAPTNGAAWQALAEAGPSGLSADELAQVRAQLSSGALRGDDRSRLHAALASCAEHAGEWAAAFTHYTAANQLRGRASDANVAQIEDRAAQARDFFTKAFYAARAGYGASETGPVIVLGLPGCGATKVARLLSAHRSVQGLHAMPNLPRLALDFGGYGPRPLNTALLADLGAEEWTYLGWRYLASCAAVRRTDASMFVEAPPGNFWLHAGLIPLLLPNARIVAVRHAPMSAGFALFTAGARHAAEPQPDQRNTARHCLAYDALMAHFDAVLLPGRVHHVQYESLLENTESEIRRLIDYCGLTFDEGCLLSWETERTIQTPCSKWVRQPMFKNAVDQWTHYAQWLGPMRAAFKDLVTQDVEAAHQAALVRAGA